MIKKFILCAIVLSCLIILTHSESESKPKKKNIIDYSEYEIEKIYQEWSKNDKDRPVDDDDEDDDRRRPKGMNIDINNLKGKGMEDIKKLNMKGKALMMFITVSGNPSKAETEEITSIWQSSLFNANYEITRYIIEDNQAIFMLKDGSMAYEIKDYLIKQDRCLEVMIDKEKFPGVKFQAKQDL